MLSLIPDGPYNIELNQSTKAWFTFATVTVDEFFILRLWAMKYGVYVYIIYGVMSYQVRTMSLCFV